MAVITAAEYKTDAGISGSDLDTWLAAVIPQAQSRAEEWCDRNFDLAARTEYYDGMGVGTIQLRTYPVTVLTSVSYLSGVSSGTPSFTAFDSGSYWFDAASGELHRYSAFDAFPDAIDREGRAVWPDGGGADIIKVVYTAGYSTMPDGLKLAMFRLIDYLRGLRGRDGAMQSESMGSYSYTRAPLAGTVDDDLMWSFGFGPYRKGVA